MSLLVEKQVDARRLSAWAVDSLSNGPSLALSRLVANTFDWNAASARVFADESIPDERLYSFANGGVATDHSQVDAWLKRLLASKLSRAESVCLVEDWTVKPSAEFLTAERYPFLALAGEVYYHIGADELSNPHWGRIWSNTPAGFHAFVLRGPLDLKATRLDLSAIVRRVVSVIVGVYDGESYAVVDVPGLSAARSTDNT